MSRTVDLVGIAAWKCPWYEQEVGFVKAIPRPLLRWALQIGMISRLSPMPLLKTLIFGTSREEAPSNWSELSRHLFIIETHMQKMGDLLVFRMSMVECPTGEELLSLAVTNGKDGHVEQCPHCRSQIGYLKSLMDFREEYERLRLRADR